MNSHCVQLPDGFIAHENFKLEKGPTDKAKEPDPGGSDQQNLGFKKLKNRKTDRTVGLNFCNSNISSGSA